MIDFQRTIDDIQSILYSGGMLPLDALSSLSQSYARACEEANQRLRGCQELLRKGLRAEAIQRCDVEPNLLDLVNTLDFPERAQWCAVLRDSKLATPPELLIEVAADLNAAYAQEEPLTAMMRRHRLLALARAPLQQRISTLRQILEADPENPIWEEDLKSYERVRHDQIQTATAIASRQNDVGALSALEREVQEPSWKEPPPAALVRGISQATVKARISRAREELAALAPKLSSAHSEMAYDEAFQLREHWRGAAREANLQPSDPLAQSIASVLEWLEIEDEKQANKRAFTMAVAELEQALDDNAAQVELERLHARSQQFDQEVPQSLESLYQNRLDSLTLATARRSKLILVTTVGVLLLTAAVTGAFIVQQIRSQTVSRYAVALGQLLDENKLGEAEDYWTKLREDDASAAAEPQLAELKVRLDGLRRAETARRSAFDKALEAARSAPLDQPDRRAIDEAERLAKTEDERLQLRELEGKIAAHQRDMQRQRDDAFAASIDEFSDLVARIGNGELLEFESREDAVNHLLSRVATLEREGLDVSDEVRGNLDALKVKLESWRRTEMANRRRDQQLARITAAVGNEQAFRDALLKYATEFPGTDRAETFTKVAKAELPLWEAIAAWDSLVRQWSDENATNLSSAEAAKRIETAKALLAKHPLFFDAGAVKQRLPYLEAITRRVGAGGRIETELIERYFHHDLVSALYEVHDADGTRYFCRDKPTGDTIRYLPDDDANATLRLKLLTPEIVATAVEAPQSVECGKAEAALTGMTDEDWETTFLGILSSMYANERMDPVIKVQLMDAVLRVACTGSRCLDSAFGRPLEAFHRLSEELKVVDWVAPNDKAAQRPRAKAAGFLKSMGPRLSSATAQCLAIIGNWRSPRLQIAIGGSDGCFARTRTGGDWHRSLPRPPSRIG